ncbi:RagB/SusD family nutrient uptake outer membrane protein [Gillisia sp. Hel_I_29]|uniref:RagB/SusD family nutrient uptake outer membrane protein n=1 Tax=Gillisia sp. Hel_I_29 TaxID=1249975 RepID=UPI000551818B|nr:RagB/SusD family nutrient uptake outer membrane protein [Gillisia sp. Hel_I_29]
MKLNIIQRIGMIIFLAASLISCEDFVEVETPNDKLIRTQVFEDDATAKSAMVGIYNQLRSAAFSNGSRSSVTLLSGLSADNIRNINTTNFTRMEFEQNELLPNNPNNLDIWSSAYNMIYMTNSLLEGLVDADKISDELRTHMEGEARFIRAFTYFYLVNLYGDVPLVLTTDYSENELVSRNTETEVYEQVLYDLNESTNLLSTDYYNGERTIVNKYAATALLARVYLYLEDYEKAEELSSTVILANSTYEILDNLDDVFLANSKEAIWQISPIGSGGQVSHTNEGNLFIIDPIFSFLASIQLQDEFVKSFNDQDRRFTDWIGYHPGKDAFFAYKYKIRNSNEFPIKEYSMVLRLAEQYLIRAEARAKQGMISEAIEDIDIIRGRAGLDLLADINPTITHEQLLNEILEERRKELFAEWGHRWLDLKRTGKAGEVLGENNPLWENTDVLYPIPSEERMKNPNLSQNNGY